MPESVLTAAEMQALDSWAINDLGIPSLTLMENAGRAVFAAAEEWYPEARRVLVVIGKGNNGGDGFVVARLLHASGRSVRGWMIFPETAISGDALVNLESARAAGVPLIVEGTDFERELAAADLVIDAIFGTGLRGAPRGKAVPVIEALQRTPVPIMAVDGPSGVQGDSGRAEGACVRAQHTVALAQWKVGHLLPPGRGHCGLSRLADIGIPAPSGERAARRHRVVAADLEAGFPRRPADSHKGSVGRLLVLAGSRGMLGAACLAAEAALRSGAGYVVLAAPNGVIDALAAKLLEVVLRPLEDDPMGRLAETALPDALEAAERADAVVLGPGLGQAESFINAFLEARPDRPCIIDADGLRGVREGLLNPALDVITPHAGELARLLGEKRQTIEADPLAAAESARERFGVTVLLKGSPTIVATPSGDTFLSTTGNAGMATAGCGDVLAGAIGALLAAGLPAPEAAWMGAWLHGRAGDLAAQSLGIGLLARDVREALPAAIRELNVAGQ